MPEYFNPQLLIQLAVEWMGVIAVAIIFTASPRFKRQPITFKYPRRELYVALSVWVLVWVALWFIYSRLPAGTNPADPGLWILTAALTAAPFAAALALRRQPLRSAGLNTKTLNPALIMGLGLALITLVLRGKVEVIIYGLPAGTPAMLPALLIFAIGWEFAFRGFVQPRLATRIGDRWGWLATAGFSAITVLPFRVIVAQAAWPFILADVALELVKSLLAGWMVQKNGGDVLPLAIYRAIHDWAFFI